MKTREDIITSMCYTWRHDYGLNKHSTDASFEAGMSTQDRELLWNQMAQVFDNNIAPYMNFKKEHRPRRSKDEKAIQSELGYSRIGATAFRRGK